MKFYPFVSINDFPLTHQDEAVVRQVDFGGANLWSTPGVRLGRAARVRRDGDWLGDAYYQAKSIEIKGKVWADTVQAAETQIFELKQALQGKVSLQYRSNPNGDAKQLAARLVDELLIDWVSYRDGDATFSYSIQLLASDPRWLGDTVIGETGLASVTGGLTVGATETLGLIPFTIDAHTTSGVIELANDGLVSGDVLITLTGVIENPIIVHRSASGDHVLEYRGVIQPGDQIAIDCGRRTVATADGVSRSQWLIKRGWHGFDPGSNTWSLSGRLPVGAVDSGNMLRVEVRPAWL